MFRTSNDVKWSISKFVPCWEISWATKNMMHLSKSYIKISNECGFYVCKTMFFFYRKIMAFVCFEKNYPFIRLINKRRTQPLGCIFMLQKLKWYFSENLLLLDCLNQKLLSNVLNSILKEIYSVRISMF